MKLCFLFYLSFFPQELIDSDFSGFMEMSVPLFNIFLNIIIIKNYHFFFV